MTVSALAEWLGRQAASSILETARRECDRIAAHLIDAGFAAYELDEEVPRFSPVEWLRLRLALLLGAGVSDLVLFFDESSGRLTESERKSLAPLLKRAGGGG